MLRPAARVALRAGVALRPMKQAVELACYHEARRAGMKMREISKALDVSMSKVGALSNALKEHLREPDTEHGLARQILGLLRIAPLTATRIVNALPDFDTEEVEAELARMLEREQLRLVHGRTTRYALTAQAYRLQTDTWLSKIDGLNTLLDHVERAVQRRLVQEDPQALVRNLTFSIRPEDNSELQRFYQEELFPFIVALDEAAEETDDASVVNFSILWSSESAADKEPTANTGEEDDA